MCWSTAKARNDCGFIVALFPHEADYTKHYMFLEGCLICRIWALCSNIYPGLFYIFQCTAITLFCRFHSLLFCILIWFSICSWPAPCSWRTPRSGWKPLNGVKVHNVNAASHLSSAYALPPPFLLVLWCVFHSLSPPLRFIKAISFLTYLCGEKNDWAYCRGAEIDVKYLSNILTHSSQTLFFDLPPSWCSWRRSAFQVSWRINNLGACAKKVIFTSWWFRGVQSDLLMEFTSESRLL